MESMKRPAYNSFLKIALSLGLVAILSCLTDEGMAQPKTGSVIPLSTPPSVKPQSLPQSDERGSSPLSADTQGSVPDYMKYEPYNTFPREIDLWTLEASRFIHSIPVVSPEKSVFAYSDVMFVANIRQTISKMYLVHVPPPPVQPQPHLPSEDVNNPPTPPLDPKAFQDRYDPDKTLKFRINLAQVGFEQVKPFDFKTLTIVDWSASGRKLLFKERSGTLHVGVKVTDILIYDEEKGTVTIYPEVQRVITNYWVTHGNQANMSKLSWEIQPLGWEPGSDSNVLMKAWAFDKKEKKFLGLWRYDVDAERTTLLQLMDDPVAVAANGWIATPLPIAPPASDQPAWKQRLRHPFQHPQ